MIGVLLHLAALAPAAVATHVASAALSLLGRGTPDPSEVDQLAAECDALRAERDLARLEHAAAVEVCDELKELLATARKEREEWKQNAVNTAQDALRFAEEHHKTRADLEALRAAVRRHLAADTLDQAEPAWRALEALLPEVKP